MIKPVINEIFPSTGIMIRNKYIDSFRRAYFINKIYESGIKNIEIGSFSKDQPFVNGIQLLHSITNHEIYKSGFVKMSKDVVIKPYVNQIIYHIYSNNDENIRVKGLSINESIIEFNKIKEKINLPTKLVIEGDIRDDFSYIYDNTQPNIVEVNSINNIILKTIDNVNNLSVRPSSLEEVDKAYYEQIYNYSSSILPIRDHIETISLIKHLQGKMGVEITKSLTGLTEVQKEIMDEFNW
jgi:hypothetical protein